MHHFVIAIIALCPAIVFTLSLTTFSPREFGLSMHPVAIAALYFALFGPMLSAPLSLWLRARFFMGKGENLMKERFGVIMAAIMMIIWVNYILSVIMMVLINVALPAIGVYLPRIV